uniref:SCP domain-containing protein n=2 Tax=Bursaphelenchus xylophilus TaxID=6326 RepID=A0A1I7RI48_BURXY
MAAIPAVVLITLLLAANAEDLQMRHRQAVLKNHNRYRRDLAHGNVVNKDGRSLPSAKNMYEFKYNLGLEKIAKKWAERCKFEHSPPEKRQFTGEAMYTWTQNIDPSILVDNATEFWWKELPNFGIDPTLEFTPKEFSKGIGHFTQMAWGDTTSVGCAVKLCPQFAFLVCNYSPAGNIFHKPIYQKGRPCKVNSDCDRYPNSKCNSKRGLCVRGRVKNV